MRGHTSNLEGQISWGANFATRVSAIITADMLHCITTQRQRILLILTAITIALTLIACGKSGSEETSTGAGQPPVPAVANPRASFTATPNPVTVTDGTKLGITKLTWNTTATKFVEIHVGKPDGPLLCQGFGSGSCDTAKWVTDGMTFYLQDSTGKVTDPSATLAAVTVQVK